MSELTRAEAAGYMARALRLAERGLLTTHPNPRVGCVIVRGDKVVGEGYHAWAGQAHAEIEALRQAGGDAEGADLFVALEPCAHHGRTPPCVDALIAARPKRVWAAMSDPNPEVAGRGIARLREAGIDVDVGLLAQAAQELNRGFVSRMTRGRPWISVKLAASLDGRTAMAGGESQWITGIDARRDGHRLRARAGAVLTGIGTVLADDPRLTVRDVDEPLRQPDRIVVDSQARAPASAAMWREGARRLWCTAQPGAAPHGVERMALPQTPGGGLELAALFTALAQRGVNEVLVEAGPRLSGAVLKSGLVDEVICYLAPCVLGDGARGMAHLPGLDTLARKLALRFVDVRRVGPDLRLTLRPEAA